MGATTALFFLFPLGTLDRVIVGRFLDYESGGLATSLPNGLRERSEVVILFISADFGHAQHVPAKRSGDLGGMLFTQIPAVRLRNWSEGAYDSGGFCVRVGQRSDCGLPAPRATATTKITHSSKSRPLVHPLGSFLRRAWCYPRLTSPNVRLMDVRTARNRHGRGMRGPLLPQTTPRFRTRSQLFDAAVLEAYAPIVNAYPHELSNLDIAVDTIPRMRLSADMTVKPDEIVADGPVPLGRVIPAGIDRHGKPTRPRLVIFRKPIEARCINKEERSEILGMVLTTLVAQHLGIDPTDIDPDFAW